MRLIIEYLRDTNWPICAKAYFNERLLLGFGKTKEQARDDLIAKAKMLLDRTPLPDPEEVEI